MAEEKAISILRRENRKSGLICFPNFAHLTLYILHVTFQFPFLASYSSIKELIFQLSGRCSSLNKSMPFTVQCSQRQISNLLYYSQPSFGFLYGLVEYYFFFHQHCESSISMGNCLPSLVDPTSQELVGFLLLQISLSNKNSIAISHPSFIKKQFIKKSRYTHPEENIDSA